MRFSMTIQSHGGVGQEHRKWKESSMKVNSQKRPSLFLDKLATLLFTFHKDSPLPKATIAL